MCRCEPLHSQTIRADHLLLRCKPTTARGGVRARHSFRANDRSNALRARATPGGFMVAILLVRLNTKKANRDQFWSFL
jgi:hypothetical protein